MRYYCKILLISYKDHVTNEEVRANIQQAIGLHEDILNVVKRRKLQYVVWSCLPFIRSGQTILQGTVKRGRRQGRHRKRWEDKIGEWTGLQFAKSQRAGENREKWRKLVAKSSVVPKRPSRLNRWWWLEWKSKITDKINTTTNTNASANKWNKPCLLRGSSSKHRTCRVDVLR